MAKRNVWKEFWQKLNNPPNWIAVSSFVATFVVLPLAIFALILDQGHNLYAAVAASFCVIPFIYVLMPLRIS